MVKDRISVQRTRIVVEVKSDNSLSPCVRLI